MGPQQEGPCCLDGTACQHTTSPNLVPAQGAGKTGVVRLFGGVFVGAVAEEMYRNWKVIVQSSGTAFPAPTAPGGIDGGSSACTHEPASPALPAALRLPRGGPSPSEEGQQAAGDEETRPAGTGALSGLKRTRGDGPDGGRSEGDGRSTRFVSECSLPTEKGMFRLRAYRYSGRHKSHEPVVMACGEVRGRENVPVRVHDQCQTSEVFGSKRCDCKEQLDQSLRYVQENGGGAVIYLAQEGRGIGLANKVAAYNLQDGGLDTVEANRQLGFKDDERSYECVGFILRDMGIKSIRLMTNNPFKIDRLRATGVKVKARIPIQVPPNEHNRSYLEAKATRMSHLINNL